MQKKKHKSNARPRKFYVLAGTHYHTLLSQNIRETRQESYQYIEILKGKTEQFIQDWCINETEEKVRPWSR